MDSIQKTEIAFDKATVTFPIKENCRLGIKSKLLDLMDPNQKDYTVRAYRDDDGGYGNTFEFRVKNESDIGYFNFKVSIYPYDKRDNNFIRFEFNPTKVGQDDYPKIRYLLIKILGIKLARAVFYEGRLTRLDTAIDVYDRVDNCYMYMVGANCSDIYRGEDGEVESMICGSNRSKVRVTLYDKSKEQARHLSRSPADSYDWFRLEIVNRDLGFAMADIPSYLKNHFKKLHFYHDLFLVDGYFDDDFLAAVRENGVNAAFKVCGADSNLRRRYLRRLELYVFDPFKLRRLTIKPGVRSLKFLSSSKYVPTVAV